MAVNIYSMLRIMHLLGRHLVKQHPDIGYWELSSVAGAALAVTS
jgi:hypothetical protein